MTSLLGKWKWVVVIVLLGNFAFAKANSRPQYAVKKCFTTDSIASYTIDRFIERDALFALLNKIDATHSIKAELIVYTRSANVTVALGLRFTSASGVVTNMHQERTDGIAAMCVVVSTLTNQVVRAQTCDRSIEKGQTSLRGDVTEEALRVARLERIAAVKERIAASQENAALRIEQQRAQNRLVLEQRKLAITTSLEAARKRTDSITQQAMQAREEQRLSLQYKNDARLQELEQARLDALKAEKKAIAIQTALLAAQAQEEQLRLIALQEENARVAQAGEAQQEAIIASHLEAQFKKDSLNQAQRGLKRQRLTVERVRLEKAQVNRERIIREKNKLVKARQEQEAMLKRLELANNKTTEIIALRKEQNNLKEQITLLELERQEVDAVLTAPLLNEDFLYEGFLYFNADQCYYKVVSGFTYVFDNLGGLLFVLDNELEKGDALGTLTIKDNPYNYILKNDVLTITDGYGAVVNQYGAPLQRAAPANSTAGLTRQPFVVSREFIITSTTTQQDIDALAIAIESLGHQFQLYDFERTLAGTLKKVVFYIDENNYSFSVSGGIPSIIIQYDEKQNRMRVKASS